MTQGWLPVADPVAFSIAGFDIMWYGITMAGGVVLGFILLFYRTKKVGLNSDIIYDLIIACVPSGIICSRLYYVLFEWDYYATHLSEIIDLRSGGLAIHGAIIGGFGAAIFVLRHYKQSVAVWFDLAVPSLALAQAIARWGNYFNSEAHGTATDLPWAIYADGEWVHPTFLYESIWCFLLFIFLTYISIKGKQKFDWQITCLYGILYSMERFFVEGLRTDSLMIGSFRQAQVLSVAVIVIAAIAYAVLSRKGTLTEITPKALDDENKTETETETE